MFKVAVKVTVLTRDEMEHQYKYWLYSFDDAAARAAEMENKFNFTGQVIWKRRETERRRRL